MRSPKIDDPNLVGSVVMLSTKSIYWPEQCKNQDTGAEMTGVICGVQTHTDKSGCNVEWEAHPKLGPRINFYYFDDLYYFNPEERYTYDYKLPTDEFNNMVSSRVDHVKSTLIAKGAEYALGGDRFHNFKEASKMTLESKESESPTQCLHGMMMKHLVSIKDLCDGQLANTDHYVSEKIGDAIAYLLLLEGLLLEERNAE